MTGHDAKPVRSRRPGDIARWDGVCPCGWRADGKSREDAASKAAVHAGTFAAMTEIAGRMTCGCIDWDSLEFDPSGECDKCRLVALLAVA